MFTSGISSLLANVDQISKPEGLFLALGRLETFLVELSEHLQEGKPEHAVAAAFLSDGEIVSDVRNLCAEYLFSAWFMASLPAALEQGAIDARRFSEAEIIKAMKKIEGLARPVGEVGARVEEALAKLVPEDTPVKLSEEGL
jgi:hypothetical protein